LRLGKKVRAYVKTFARSRSLKNSTHASLPGLARAIFFSKSAPDLQVKNPVDGSVISTVPHMDAADTKLAIEAAHKVTSAWPQKI
jgi:acyl-CoA reductase-like NAD-dependent aldehyde dehydrogenase